MKRLMPFRDYDEHDVINLFALNTANEKIGDSGDGDSGVIVAVSSGAITGEAVSLAADSYLGETSMGYVGASHYPTVPLKVAPATTGSKALGVTLFETAKYDENGEKLLYYRQKALENQVILTGQAVPILTRGVVTLDDSAFASSIPAPGTSLVVSATAGKFDALGVSGVGTNVYGLVLATGSRIAIGNTDYYAGSAGSTGTYAIVKLDF
jgi:hypothetical protein